VIKRKGIPKAIIFLSLGVILLSATLFVIIDLRNWFGLGTAFSRHFFWNWYGEGGPIELLQYMSLGAASVLFAYNSGRTRQTDALQSRFSIIMAFALCMMLIEDAGNPRHEIRGWVEFIFSEEHYGVFGTLTELLYFAVLASIPIFALLVYGRKMKAHLKPLAFLLVGFAAYGIAVSLSFIGSAFEGVLDTSTYALLGDSLKQFSIAISDGGLEEYWHEGVPFRLMDGMVEESIELFGAMSLLAASFSFLHHSSERGN